MPEYLAPGVYVEEFEIGAKPIEGVSTSTAAFVGIAEKGPLNKPTLVTSQKEFTSIFGGYIKESYLAYSVDGFFRNGGKRCFIVRVTDSNASKAHQCFNNKGGTPLMEISALNEGKWGEKINVTIQEASSGSTVLFLDRLSEDAKKNKNSIKLSTTIGLFKGINIVIDDGSNKESLKVASFGPENVVNLTSNLSNAYNRFITYVYTQLPKDSLKSTVKSVSGFSKGMLVEFHSAKSDKPVYVTLSSVKQQPDRLLEWSETSLSNSVDGAVCIDIKGIKTKLKLNKFNDIGKNQIEIENNPSLKKDDKITFSDGIIKEELTVKSISEDGTTVDFYEKFSNMYDTSAEVIAMTSSQTTFFITTLESIKNSEGKSTLSFSKLIKGLEPGDSLTIFDDGKSSSFDVEMVKDDKVIMSSEIDHKYIKRYVYLTLNKKEIVVDSLEGFSTDSLIDIKIGENTSRYVITGKDENKNIIKVDGHDEGPDLSKLTKDNLQNCSITAKQWIQTTVKSQDFQITAIYGNNELEEIYEGLSIDRSSERYFARERVINKASSLIEITDKRENKSTFPKSINYMPASLSSPLKDGNDGITNITASDYIGTTNTKDERTGIVALEPVDEVSLLAIPDIMNDNLSSDGIEQVQLAMIGHCENLKDRFAILDPIKNSTVQEVQAWRKDNLDSKYAAIYYPWIKVSDPIMAEYSTSRFIPPSGHIAGIYARSDVERGVHKAPANEVVSGVTELERTLTTREQEVLNPDGVNCIRVFQGRGIRVWGARTISSDPLWKYINIRRLFIFIEKSIEKYTQWVVFEPNNEKLWARVRATITQFLTTVWRDGALMGTTPEEAFFVKCDRTTMTQNDIDNGRLIVQIGIAPVKPAEFVIFRIAQWAGGSAATE